VSDHEERYDAMIDAVLDQPRDGHRTLALEAVRWYRWARVVFVVPDEVQDGELRQWIGERLSNGQSIVRTDDHEAREEYRQWLEKL